MLDGTRIVPVYFRYDGPEEPRFGDEIDDDGFAAYAYYGWLPLQTVTQGRQRPAQLRDLMNAGQRLRAFDN